MSPVIMVTWRTQGWCWIRRTVRRGSSTPVRLFTEFMLTGGPGDLARFDVLHTPDDLRRWAQASRLELDPSLLDVTPDDVQVGRELRDALWRSSLGHHRRPAGGRCRSRRAERRGEPSRSRAAGRAGPASSPGRRRPPEPPCCRRWPGTRSHVLTGPTVERLRECEGDNCRLVFLDTSRPGDPPLVLDAAVREPAQGQGAAIPAGRPADC